MPQGTKKKRIEALQSSAQQLGSIVKSCRDIMRKDKGLNGDIDRLPMLTWIMFLKFLEKYVEYGTAQFQIPDILKVPPISERGNVMEIADLFGGGENLRGALAELQQLLYAA